jgi:RNA polymerase sigma-70 factor, ECF subfamily
MGPSRRNLRRTGSSPAPNFRPLQPLHEDNMVTNPTDLLDQARAGNESALGQLLENYSRYLTLLARVQIGRRLQGKVDADDLVQDTFMDAHRQITSFRGTTEAEFVAWLRRILAGQLAQTIRRYLGTKGRDAMLERELAVQLDQSGEILDRGLVASQSTPSQHASRREQGVLLAEALDKLPKDYREVIILRHLEDLPLVEAARRMGRSEDSVQKLWVRALVSLRKQMGGNNEPT